MAKFCNQCGKPVPHNANFCTGCGMSVEGKTSGKSEWTTKRAKVMGKQPVKWKFSPILFGIFAAAVITGYFVWPHGGNAIIKAQPVVLENVSYSTARKQMVDISAKVENGKIVIPLDAVKEKKFVAFNYVTPNNNVPLLAYISGEGKIITAVSMCEPCDSRRFHIRGDKLVCNSCGSTWDLDNLETISGSCGKYPPDAIPSVVEGNNVLIDETIVKQWTPRI